MTDYGDQYFTPRCLTRALLTDIDARPMRVVEPCAGDGWISSELERAGHTVVAGDVDKHARVEHAGVDFFSQRATRLYEGCDAIITNPPFSAAPRCVRRARELAPLVIMLLRISFLEPCEKRESSRRDGLVQDLSRFIVLPRVSFYRGKRGSDSVTCAWFIWDQNHTGPRTFEIVTESELARYAGQGDLFIDAPLSPKASKLAPGSSRYETGNLILPIY